MNNFKHRLEALGVLLNKYWQIFQFSWKNRSSSDDNFFNIQEAEFLPSALSVQETPASPTLKWVARLMILFFILTIAWALIGKIDIVINATGKVIASGHTKTISVVEVAKVTAIRVVDGQAVKAGDVLLELDTRAVDAEQDRALVDYDAAKITIAINRAMLRAMDSGLPPQFEAIEGLSIDKQTDAKSRLLSSYQDYQNRLKKAQGEVRSLQASKATMQKIVSDMDYLQKKRLVSTHEFLEKKQQLLDIETKLAGAEKDREGIITDFRHKSNEAVADANRMMESSEQDAIRAQSRGNLLTITSPVDGTVQQLTVHTVGGVAPAAQPLMLIVPKSNKVEIEAFVANRDIGFVREGLSVSAKFDPFEYTKYGTIEGKVTQISRDAIMDEKQGLIFSVKIVLNKNTLLVDGKEQELTPGMQASAEIKLGKRLLIEYFLTPLLKYKEESLRER